jgi:hypothetical protein
MGLRRLRHRWRAGRVAAFERCWCQRGCRAPTWSSQCRCCSLARSLICQVCSPGGCPARCSHGGQGLMVWRRTVRLRRPQGVARTRSSGRMVSRKRDDLGAQGLLGGVDSGGARGQGAGFGFGQRLAFGAREGEHHVPAFARCRRNWRAWAKASSTAKALGFLRLPGFAVWRSASALKSGLAQALGDVGLQGLGHLPWPGATGGPGLRAGAGRGGARGRQSCAGSTGRAARRAGLRPSAWPGAAAMCARCPLRPAQTGGSRAGSWPGQTVRRPGRALARSRAGAGLATRRCWQSPARSGSMVRRSCVGFKGGWASLARCCWAMRLSAVIQGGCRSGRGCSETPCRLRAETPRALPC